MSVQSRARNGTGSQPSQQMGAAELGSSSQRCVCAVPRQKWHWLTAISTDGTAELGSSRDVSVQSRQKWHWLTAISTAGAAELGSSSQRCVCAVPRQKWHWLTAISTDGSCRTRFELSEMCLCSPASEMTLAHSHLNRWELPRFELQRSPASEIAHSHSTDGSCRSRFELSEVCLCSPASEMALAQPSQLPN